MKKLTICALLVLFAVLRAQAQKSDPQPSTEVDASKPTNLYTQVNTLMEFTKLKNGTRLYGFRGNLQYSFNPDNLILAEIPLLYNNQTTAFGLSDIRVRYFGVVKRVQTPEKFSVVAPFIDVTLPTGSFKDGLGSSSLVIGAGVVYGFAAAKNISMFPGLSVVHVTKPSASTIPESLKFSSTGFSTQVNMSISFTKTWFLFVNPIATVLHGNNNWKTTWTGEFNLNHMVVPNKLKANLGYFPNFTYHSNTIRAGATFYL
ncbi:hypothetical protein ACFSQP_00770 [Bizionia sediminis]|uniref:Outer membrane beta-barrel protein n=1 Tax=Bizionia sediminis TaxID=1737064 RepID=A0ABW5KMW8_9FLAO